MLFFFILTWKFFCYECSVLFWLFIVHRPCCFMFWFSYHEWTKSIKILVLTVPSTLWYEVVKDEFFVRKLQSDIRSVQVCDNKLMFIWVYWYNWKNWLVKKNPKKKEIKFKNIYCIKCINWNKWCCTRLLCWKFIARLWVPGNKIFKIHLI